MKSLTLSLALLCNLFFFAIQATGAESGDARAAIAPDNKNIHVRGGIADLKVALEADKKCHVAFLGGSITQNSKGHTAMVPAWLKETYPDTEFTFTNAGLSSTCSTSGSFRIDSHVFAKGDIDLLVVEFAVNDDQDAVHARRECTRGMEGIVHKTRRDHPGCQIIMVQFINPPILEKLQAGETPVSIGAHEAVAEHYGITSVNVAAEIADAATAKRYTWKDYGGTHPGKFGYRVASNMIISAIERGLVAKPGSTPVKLPAPLDADSYDKGSFVPVSKAKTSGEWKTGKVSRELLPLGAIRGDYTVYDVLRADKPGAELSLEFEGRAIGAFVLAGPDAGILEASIDGAPTLKTELFHHYSSGLNYPRSVIFGSGLKPGKHVIKLRLSEEKHPKSKGTSASILFFEVNG